MRFERQRKFEPVAWTARKLALASSAPMRRQQREQERLPLLADQLEPPPVLDARAELAARQRHSQRLEASLRALDARVWREARRDYFAAPEPERRAIRQAWAAWRGPATALYFRYVVDQHTGVCERRAQLARQREADLRRHHARQSSLDFRGHDRRPGDRP